MVWGGTYASWDTVLAILPASMIDDKWRIRCHFNHGEIEVQITVYVFQL
jgi:hypothetical protein